MSHYIGFVGVSMHTTRDMDMKISSLQPGLTVSNLPVTVDYGYGSYGWFYFARTPESVTKMTNSNDNLILQFSYFLYQVNMKLNDENWFSLAKRIRMGGGDLKIPFDEPKYRIRVTPHLQNE